MIGSVARSHWCTACVVLFLGALGWMMLAGGSVLIPASADVLVWCCVHDGQACTGDYDPAQCAAQGRPYSGERDLCEAACTTQLSLHGAPTTR